jgi:ABC-type nickel/cobalt efflux system permease component RcnA
MPSPLPGVDLGDAVDSVAHVIQVALTPVFLLSGIGTLLNVFNTRLSRVSDHREHVVELLRGEVDDTQRARLRSHLTRLRRRTMVLDASVVLGAIGGASTCGAAFVLFLGSMRDTAIASWLFVLFGLALGCTACALVAFLADSVLAWHGLHREGSLPRPS